MGELAKILSNNKLLVLAKHNATQLITAALNGYVVTSPDEILIMDTPKKETAKRVWRWNIAGLGYSKDGYNGPYETAMTMDGAIVADFITAGILSGVIIRSIAEGSMLEINGAKMHFSFNGEKYGNIGTYGPTGESTPDWTLDDMVIGIGADERSGGVAIYSNDVDSDKLGYPIARFVCESKDSKKTLSAFYGKQRFYGEEEFYGISEFKNAANFERRVNMKYPLYLYNPDGAFRGELGVSGTDAGNIYLTGLSGKNKVVLGYKDNETAGFRSIIEASSAWSDYQARIHGGLKITGDMATTGTKNRIVDIGDKKVLMNAYETADCLFGDSGSGFFDYNGELVVDLDETFRKTIEGDYSIFAYGYSGSVTVKAKKDGGFILIGTPGSRVDYEVRAKQKGYTGIRLKEFKGDVDGEH